MAPDWVKSGSVFFITICCEKRDADQLCIASTSSRLLGALAHYHQSQRWWLHLALLMPDHVHMLASFPAFESMPTTVKALKRYTAREFGIEWQRGFFDHRLRGHEGFDEKAHYIRMNPVRKGLARTPDEWPHVWVPATPTMT